MRLFVAAEPSESVRLAAAATSSTLRAALEVAHASRGFRSIPPENLHLTVWFLGEVSDPRGVAILDTLRPPLAERPFTLRLSGLGAFPPSGSPRVLWMGVAEGLDALARLHDEVGARLLPWGFQPEGRPYSAHLTLARIKEPLPSTVRAALRETLRHSSAEAGSCRVDALTVFRSRTSPAGALYERLLRVPLS